MKKYHFLCILLFNLLIVNYLAAQKQLHGTITDERGQTMIGATVRWENLPNQGAATDSVGKFSIARQASTANLEISYVGYQPAVVSIDPTEDNLVIELSGMSNNLPTTDIVGRQSGSSVSTLKTVNQEVITQQELRRAPCCNLAESFESNGTVDVSYSNAVTGATEIQMLGLRGIYTQFQVENRPAMTGLATPVAMELIPGTWLQSIQISKGASTVRNGFAGMTGQINADFVTPDKDNSLFVNLFGNTASRMEANVHLNRGKEKGWSQGLLLHASSLQSEIDHNSDGFLDMPLKRQLNGLFRAKYHGDIFEGRVGLQAVTDSRTSGQLTTVATNGQPLYAVQQKNDRVELFGNLGYIGFKAPYRNLGSIFSMSLHSVNEKFGNTTHIGTQKSAFLNILYTDIIKTTDHNILFGFSQTYDNFREKLNDLDLNRTESVTGVLSEYTFTNTPLGTEVSDFSLIVGGRVDYHNRFGWLPTPRISAKYNFNENTIVRANIGRAFRSPNLIPDNESALVSSRIVKILDQPRIEEAWNAGINFTKKIDIRDREFSASIDLYRTWFQNQIVMDMDSDYRQILFYNLRGSSFANSFLAVLQYEFFRNFNVKVAYKYNDVRTTYLKGLERVPLVPKSRLLLTFEYKTLDKSWLFNVTTQVVGQQRLWNNEQVPMSLVSNFPNITPVYALLNAQVTKVFNERWEVYAGGENLSNYTQHHAIIDASQPFGPYFNGNQVFAPTMGIRGFVGVRYKVK